jgi:hypothetical protein
MSEVQFAKKHIRNRFSLMVVPHISDGIWSVYENANTICDKNKEVSQTLKTFQNLLTYIPKWDESRLNTEVERIQTASGCSYLEELLTATLITYLRAFAAIQYSSNQDIEVEFERPPLPRFIHELYKECARQCWTHAYLFKTYSTTMEQQARSRKEIDQMLEIALDTTLDSFLPWKSIVEKYFKDPGTGSIKSDIVPTDMLNDKKESDDEDELEEDKRKVGFAVEDDTSSVVSEDEKPNPSMKLSDEECEIDVEELNSTDIQPDKEELITDLETSDELVLNM